MDRKWSYRDRREGALTRGSPRNQTQICRPKWLNRPGKSPTSLTVVKRLITALRTGKTFMAPGGLYLEMIKTKHANGNKTK